jgi:hypothetical protein
MKLSPMTQYKLAFWSITGPLLVPMFFIVLFAIVNPFWFRGDMLRWTESYARKLSIWRDERTFVKHFYDKAHLFDKLKA